MTRAGNSFDLAQIVRLGCGIIAAVFGAKWLDFVFIGWADVLSYDLFSDIPANIFAVFTRFLHLSFLLFCFKDLRQGSIFLIF